jgi:elongation factor Ts
MNDYKPTPEEVAKLREITNKGLMECKKALIDTKGDMEQAKELLRKRGWAVFYKKAL